MTRTILGRATILVIMLAGVMAVSVVLPASGHVGSLNHTWGKHYQPKVEAMLDDGFRWAAVDSSGALVRGSGATSATKSATGTYLVTFGQNISACSYTATSWDTAGGSVAVYARIEVGAGNGLSANQVRVGIINTSTDALADFGFSLQLMC